MKRGHARRQTKLKPSQPVLGVADAVESFATGPTEPKCLNIAVEDLSSVKINTYGSRELQRPFE